MKRCIQMCFALAMLTLLSSTLQAEQKKIFDGPDGSVYEVHYIAFPSTFLNPEVAKQYGLLRSRAMGIINVSVIKIETDGDRKAVGTVIQAQQTNDLRQQWGLDFKQVIEGDSIYYLAQVQYREGEVLTFDLNLFPEGQVDNLKLRFSHTFYNE